MPTYLSRSFQLVSCLAHSILVTALSLTPRIDERVCEHIHAWKSYYWNPSTAAPAVELPNSGCIKRDWTFNQL